MSPYWSYLLAAVGVTGLWIAATRPRVGWWSNIAARAVWLVCGVATRQWGFLVTAVAYALVYARLLRSIYHAAPAARLRMGASLADRLAGPARAFTICVPEAKGVVETPDSVEVPPFK